MAALPRRDCGVSTANATSMNLVRLLDYVEVPSNYVGAERWYSPASLMNPDGSPPAGLRPEYTPPYLYRPPFNKLSRFRDPGKININTMTAELLQAVAPTLSGEDAERIIVKRTKEKRSLTREDVLSKVPKESQEAVGNMIDVRTEYFSASGMVRRGRVVAGYRALLEREAGKHTAIIALTEEPI